MRKFTITIEAKTEADADSALSWIRWAILNGYVMAPWNSDGEGSSYSFSSEGDFDDAFIHGHDDDDDANRPKAENMLLDRIVAKICKPIIAKTDSISGVRPDRLPNGKQVHIRSDHFVEEADAVIIDAYYDSGWIYHVDVTAGDRLNDHRNNNGELWVCDFEVQPIEDS